MTKFQIIVDVIADDGVDLAGVSNELSGKFIDIVLDTPGVTTDRTEVRSLEDQQD